MDLDLLGVSVGDQFGRRQRPVCEERWNLQGHDTGGHRAMDRIVVEGALDRSDDLAERGPHRGFSRVRGEGRTQRTHDVVLPGRQQRSVAAIEAFDEVERRLDDLELIGFDFEVEAGLGETLEGLLQRRNSLTAAASGVAAGRVFEAEAGIERGEIGPAEIRRESHHLRHAVDPGIVQQDRHPVARDVDIALENLRALLERSREGGEGVFRVGSRGPSVADHDGTPDVKKGVRHPVRLSCAEMGVLTRDVILRELDEGRVRIDPFEISQVGVASIDLTLGSEIREIVDDDSAIPVVDDTDYRDHTRVHGLDRPYRLEPGVTIHGITAEHVTLPDDLCGFLEGRSRFARLGLMIHVTSALVQPGVSNRQVLEMSNVSSRALEIVAGVRICQLVLMRTEGRAVYRGRFQDQREI